MPNRCNEVDNLTSEVVLVKGKDGIFGLLTLFDTRRTMVYTRTMKTLFLAILIFIFPVLAGSHPGKTDSIGGHKCFKGCEKWELLFGEYHTHDKDGKPVRVAKKVRKKRQITEKPSVALAHEEKAEAPQQPMTTAAMTLPVRVAQPEEGLSISPLMLILLALLLLLLLIRRKTRERQ